MIFIFLLFIAVFGMLSPVLRLVGYLSIVFTDRELRRSVLLDFLQGTLDLITMVGLPLVYLWLYAAKPGEVSMFSGQERNLWLAWIVLYTLAYFWLSLWRVVASLTHEIIWNTLLGAGLCLNLLVIVDLAKRSGGFDLSSIIGNGPIIILLLIMLHKRHRLFRQANGDAFGMSIKSGEDLLDEQFLTRKSAEAAPLSSDVGFSRTALELPFLQKVGLFIAAGTLLVAVSGLPGLLLGWKYALLVP